MAEVDRIMIEDLGIDLTQMMENAGRNLADLALRRFRPQSVAVVAGVGGNGGGGLVAARHLRNRGVDVTVTLSRSASELTPVPAHQMEILERMGVEPRVEPSPADVVIDAIIGYSLLGDPRGRAAELIEWMNAVDSSVLALDTPSGLDVTTGVPASPCVMATATMTLAMPKAGLVDAPEVGELFLADISVPATVYEAFGYEVATPFADGTLVRVATG